MISHEGAVIKLSSILSANEKPSGLNSNHYDILIN